ncbi:hypothetical protein [Bacillus sp. T3]|uniref:RNA polymerase factor sigma-54 n=1 Tax=Bacillus sp. T3 TaxID=467262 RepID=UPI0029813D0C|nr:hypothetical protein [Bacillus sp. T3]
MELRPGLSQQQTMKLTMTQELSQAIALLQYSSVELVDFLENKALENPLLQIKKSQRDVVRPKKKGNGKNSNDKAWIEQLSDQRFTLADHLTPQIQDLSISPKQKQLLNHYIFHLDDNGYFTWRPAGNSESI